MPQSSVTCPHCGYEAPRPAFRSLGGGQLQCVRCRGRLEDADAIREHVTYADCDAQRAVTRFPFALDGTNTVIRVREGYLALIVEYGGRREWLDEGEKRVTDLPEGFQLYYLCLRPWVRWGTKDVPEFGAYGTARLSVSREFMKACCEEARMLALVEERIGDLVSGHMTNFVRGEVQRSAAPLLEQPEAYQRALGLVTDGLSILELRPGGFRNAAGYAGSFPRFREQEPIPEEAPAPKKPPSPIAWLRRPFKTHTVQTDTEEVYFRAGGRRDRHKAGESLSADSLRDVEHAFRFDQKTLDLPCGWGVYNLPCAGPGFFSAHGTISFYVDSTEKLCAKALIHSEGWKDFEEKFFVNPLRPSLEAALKELVYSRLGREGNGPERLRGNLSALSMELHDLLNGEDGRHPPAFREYGLRVRRVDIMGLEFYGSGR